MSGITLKKWELDETLKREKVCYLLKVLKKNGCRKKSTVKDVLKVQ